MTSMMLTGKQIRSMQNGLLKLASEFQPLFDRVTVEFSLRASLSGRRSQAGHHVLQTHRMNAQAALLEVYGFQPSAAVAALLISAREKR